MSATALLPIVVLVLLLTTDAWVYLDAKLQAARGTPVIFSYGRFKVDTPPQWFFACFFVWIVFFPLYLTGRRG